MYSSTGAVQAIMAIMAAGQGCWLSPDTRLLRSNVTVLFCGWSPENGPATSCTWIGEQCGRCFRYPTIQRVHNGSNQKRQALRSNLTSSTCASQNGGESLFENDVNRVSPPTFYYHLTSQPSLAFSSHLATRHCTWYLLVGCGAYSAHFGLVQA